MIQLPTAYEGGQLIVQHAGRSKAFDLAADSAYCMSFVAFYADCRHQVRGFSRLGAGEVLQGLGFRVEGSKFEFQTWRHLKFPGPPVGRIMAVAWRFWFIYGGTGEDGLQPKTINITLE